MNNYAKLKLVLAAFLCIFGFCTPQVFAQTNCFKIESILVDACSFPEPSNEMVYFRIGNAPLNTQELRVVWPNPNMRWQGLAPVNAQSAQKTTELNATIPPGCGVILEPRNGVIPAGARVLLAGGLQNFNPTAHPFTGFNDTLYIIYQNLNNDNNTGHFANRSDTTDLRTLNVQWGRCTGTVVYDRGSLVGGDGATVFYSDTGSPTYVNNGCVAPIPPFRAAISADTVNCGALVLRASGTGAYDRLLWYGGEGRFTDPTSPNTTYIPANNEAPRTRISLVLYRQSCRLDSATTSIELPLAGVPDVQITGNNRFCEGQSTVLQATGGRIVRWLLDGQPVSFNQPDLSTIRTDRAGRWQAVGVAQNQNTCADTSAIFVVTAESRPAANITALDPLTRCAGQAVRLLAAGGTVVAWLNNGVAMPVPPADNITIRQNGRYSLVVTNGSCSDTSASVEIRFTEPFVANAAVTGAVDGCYSAGIVQLTVTPAGNYQYFVNGVAQSARFEVRTAGTVQVRVVNDAGCDTTLTATVSAVKPYSLRATLIQPSCGLDNGSVTLVPVAGIAAPRGAVSFRINGGNLQASNTFTALAPGRYTIEAVDAGLCRADTTIDLNPSAGFSIATEPTQPLCADNGSINLRFIGTFQTPVQVSLNGGQPTNTTLYTNLAGGTYTFRATDAIGCAATATLTLNADNGNVTAQILSWPEQTPEAGSVYRIWVEDIKGLLLFESTDPNQIWDGKYENRFAPAGVYYLNRRQTRADGAIFTDRRRIILRR